MNIFCRNIFLIVMFYSFNHQCSLFTTIKGSWSLSIDEECKFRCDDGQIPRPNTLHVPISNGCGVPGFKMPKLPDYIPSDKLESCCDNHDICYGTCNMDRNDCDWKFQNCLYNICSKLQSNTSKDLVKGCESIAKMMYVAVMTMGCSFYLDAQKKACTCSDRNVNLEL